MFHNLALLFNDRNEEYNESMKKLTQNIAIFLLVLIAVKNLLAALPWKLVREFQFFYATVVNPEQIMYHKMASFLLGMLMLLLVYRLYKKVRIAWCIEVSSLVLTIGLQLLRAHRFTVPIILIELYILIVLCVTYRDYGRRAERLTLRKAAGFILASLILLLANSTLGIFVMHGSFRHIHDIYDAFFGAVNLLFFLDNDFLPTRHLWAKIYVDSLISINWICIFAGLYLLLKPMVYNPLITKKERDRVRQLVLKYGQSSSSYLALEHDKRYFFSHKVDGVCAYTVTSDVFVICSDIICAKENSRIFLKEILAYCEKNAYQLLLVTITDYFLEEYQELGLGVVKYGEDASFTLSDYNLAGGKVAKVRAAINHATKNGITVHEYIPTVARNHKIEEEIRQINNEWLSGKGGFELHFMLGGDGLKDPLDRRYFYAADSEGALLGYVVFLPYTDGYLADVTRRRNDAPQGVLEKIIFEAFMQFKEEGVLYGNMGLSPLYNIAENDRQTLTEKLFTYIYNNMNSAYGFQKLHHAKEKYAPTDWLPRYLAFYPKPFSPKLAFALVRCQMKKGIANVVMQELFRKK